MRFVIFTHSLVSDWNHGNAHFLRGVCTELQDRGHSVNVYEPADSWSRQSLLEQEGPDSIEEFHRRYPTLRSTIYDEREFDLENILRDADVVLVHEWNTPELVSRIGKHRARHNYKLLFHDTHHRSLSDRNGIERFDLTAYDGVLAYGEIIRHAYLHNNWAKKAWTWHEAADTRVFVPLSAEKERDLVWIGNWGDDERGQALREFLIAPVKDLKLSATVYGVRYPDAILNELADAGIEYKGWLPNYRAPEVFARHRLTVHIPRRPYVEALPGIPTIRPFEALACAIPLVSAPWTDAEELFRPGRDFLFAHCGSQMRERLEMLLGDEGLMRQQAASGFETILARHTCAHRVDQLMEVIEQ